MAESAEENTLPDKISEGYMFDNSPDEKSLLAQIIEASTFGLDDLELNRQGKMSNLQRTHLGFMTVLYFGICVTLFALALGTIWVFISQSQAIPFPTVLILVILCGFGISHWLHLILPMWDDFKSGIVLCVSGPLLQISTRISTGRGTGMRLVHYRVAKYFFDVAFFAPKFIPQNQKCNVYYTQKSKIIIGIEPI